MPKRAAYSSPAPSGNAPRHSPILLRTVRHTAALLLLTIALSVLTSFLVARALLTQRFLAQLSAVIAAKEDLIEGVLLRDRERAHLLVRRVDPAGSVRQLEELMLEFRRDGAEILGMTLLASDRSVRASAGLPVDIPALLAPVTWLRPVIGGNGWDGHVVFAPLPSNEGYLAVRFGVSELLHYALDASAVGATGEVLIGRVHGGELHLLHHRGGEGPGMPLVIGGIREQRAYADPLALATEGDEGVLRTEDYRGTDVFAAHRFLPSLGWGLVVKVNTAEALHGAFLLGGLLIGLGGALLLLGMVLAVILARRLTRPLRRLAKGITHLGPGHWTFRRSIRSGDEVEQLDRVIADLTERLSDTYLHLEEEIAARTRQLREQFAKDRTILDTIEQGVLVVDEDGIVTGANPAAARHLGYQKASLIDHRIEKIFRILEHREALEGQRHPVLRALATHKHYRALPDARLSVFRKDESLLPVFLVISPLMQGKKHLGAIVVFQDITQERQLDYLKSEFISLASHQLRTPLSAIQWYTELLATEAPKNLNPAQKSYIREMQSASRRMVNLVDALLHASRLEGGSMIPKQQSVDLRAFVEQTIEDMRLLAKDRKVSTVARLPSRPVPITTDPMLLSIVFQNIFSNAIKYSRPGGEISVTLRKTGDKYEVAVADHGIGIPHGDQTQLFQKLFRAHNVRKMDTDGSGLGLYISKLIFNQLGGEIRIKSAEGKGTKVSLLLPRRMRQTKG